MKKLLLTLLIFSLGVSISYAEESYTSDDVSIHNLTEDCWITYGDSVYDLSEYLSKHDVYMDIRDWCGLDMTNDFETKAGLGRDHKMSSYSLLEVYRIGSLNNSQVPTVVDNVVNEEIDEHNNVVEEYDTEISGQELKLLTVSEVAELWEIDPEDLLAEIIQEFDLVGSYSVSSMIDTLKQEGDFAPKQIKDIAQHISDNGLVAIDNVDRANKNPYNLLIPLLGTILIYWGPYYAVKNKLFKQVNLHQFNMIFNTILLLTLIPSFGFGIFMMLRYQFPSWYEIEFEFLYWHVELSVVMGTIAISHLLQRWVQYISQIKSFGR